MNCTFKRCLSSLTWMGHPDDRALTQMAQQSGWKLYEGAGWRCKRHQPSAIAIAHAGEAGNGAS